MFQMTIRAIARDAAARSRGGGVAGPGAFGAGRPRDVQQGPGREGQPGRRRQRRLHVRHASDRERGDPGVVHAQGRARRAATYSVECNASIGLHEPVGSADADHHRARGARLHAHGRRSVAPSRASNFAARRADAELAGATATRRSIAATRKITFKLDWWEWVKCWVTNTRDTGTIKVTKKLLPATDGGKFNLLIDGTAKATNVGDGGTTGTQTGHDRRAQRRRVRRHRHEPRQLRRDHLVRRQGPRRPGRHGRQRPGRQGRSVGVRDHQHAQGGHDQGDQEARARDRRREVQPR